MVGDLLAKRNSSQSPSHYQINHVPMQRKESPESTLRRISNQGGQHAVIQENEYKSLIRGGYEQKPDILPLKGLQQSQSEYLKKLQNKTALKKPSMLDTKPSKVKSQVLNYGGNSSNQMRIKLN